MTKWLYDNDGYYSNYKAIGKGGDFYTAVSTSRFFGGAIAKRIIKTIEDGDLPKDSTIIEVGAHKGYLLADIIQFIYTLRPELLDTLEFMIIERFDNLQQNQKEYFKESFGDVIKLKHAKSFDDIKIDSAFVVANEIFDAFSCELIKDNKMAYVDDEFKIHFNDMDTHTKSISTKYKQSIGEIAVGYEEFANSMANALGRYEFITFDYGEKNIRHDFSIRIYTKHEVFAFFDEKIQISDIFKSSDLTYDVNFSHLIDSFDNSGAKTVEYKTQLSALVEFGLMELLDILRENVDNKTYLNELNKVKTLITPTVMGERFKMCRIRRGI
jgi:SAM-dependent MidA family methyltransferase